MVNAVCWRLGLPAPAVRMRRYMRRARYHSGPGDGVIAAGRNDGADTFVHELAHHVVAMRAPRYSKRERSHGGMRRKMVTLKAKGWGFAGARREASVHHGPTFAEALREVAALWYGDVDLYPWHTEYKSLRGAAHR